MMPRLASYPIARKTVRFALLYPVLTALLAALAWPEAGLLAQDEPDQAQPNEPKTLTETLGGDDRYLTHLSTDKPIYRGGETVYIRGTILHAFTQKPFDDKQDEIQALAAQAQAIRTNQPIDEEGRKQIRELNQRRLQLQIHNRLNPMVEIKDPKGATVLSSRSDVKDSVIGFKWDVPDDQPGGQYTIKVSYPFSGLAPAERTFDIRAYRPPRIKTQIDFLKDGYGPGDTVVATVQATRAEGGIPEGAKVIAIARVDGSEVARVETMVRESGFAEARFDLPGQIERGEGSLTFVIEDSGVVESASKTLPILLQTLDLNIYPEGGDLVAGVENRVYFEAKTPFGKPADIEGVLLNGRGMEVAKLQTTHEGRGLFSFTPKADEAYTLRVTNPSSVTQVFELPKSTQQGLVIHPSQTVLGFEDDLVIRLKAPNRAVGRDKILLASLVVRHREQVVLTMSGMHWGLDHRANASVTSVAGQLPDSATGILTVTAYDEDGKPLAERLIYRAPKHQVNIEIVPDSAQYTPGGEVQLTLKTTDENGNPVSAVAGVTVIDDAVLEMIETREQAPSLPAMVFLENEVQDLADAHVYLDRNNPDAADQLDLLLGTQGWRRFAMVDLKDFIEEHGEDAQRMLAIRREAKATIALDRVMIPMAAAEAVELFEEAPEREQQAPADIRGQEAAEIADPDDAALAIPDFANAPNFDLNAVLDKADLADRERVVASGLFADEPLRVLPMVFVREYAHKQPAGKPLGQRSDFTETVYWSSATKTDDRGLATITFDLSDSVTSFRVKTDAFTKDGALGANSKLIESVRPFYVEPKLPLELTAGDRVLLPIAMVNNTEEELGVELFLSKLGRAGTVNLDPIPLAADTRGRALHELTIGQAYGELAFNIEARAGFFSDVNKRKLRVVPKGFPINDGSGGMLQPDSEAQQELTIPESTVPGSLSASVTVYPTPLANLTEALEALIRDPYGCFEQTSSTTFPLVMAQQYFMSHTGVDPDLVARSKEKLDKGYQRLIGFETTDKGYEWFGKAPGHEALTAYGLLQFNEMKDVMDVDQQMIDRTADWLMSRMDDDGSFKLNQKGLDTFGKAPQDTTDAYIVWSMLEAGYDPQKLATSIDLVLKKAAAGDDTYLIALGANIGYLATQEVAELKTPGWLMIAKQLQDKLIAKLTDDGYVQGAVTSITRSGGDALKIETTSLAILAWLRDDAYTEQVEKAILWLTERCKSGRFGSTQSTVLALKAIVAYDKARATPKAPGTLTLLVDGKPVGEPVTFNEQTKGAIRLPAIASALTPGKHTITLQMAGGSKMPYSIGVDYFADTPASSDACKLRIETLFPDGVRTSHLNNSQRSTTVGEGETTEINVKVTNVTKDGLPTPLAIVGIPGGLEPDFDQLKELVAAEKIAAFEVIGRDVVLYWREIKPREVIDLSIRCTAAVPGTYTGPASRVYEYYTDEHKHWAEGLTVSVTPRKQDP